MTTIMKTPFGTVKWTLAHGVNHDEYAGMTMENLAKFFSQPPQILWSASCRHAGLKGSYQVTLDVPANPLSGPAASIGEASDPSGGSIQESLHKMGLDLVRREIQSEKLVIDRIEKTPTPN